MHFFWLALGLLLIVDTLFALRMSNFNLGVVLPAVLGAPLCCYGILLWFAPQALLLPVVKTILTIFTVGYLCVLLGLLFCVIVTVCYALSCKSAAADVVIVLGAGLRGDRPSRLLRTRLESARKAAEARNASLLVTGGQGRQELIPEAVAMQRYLLEQGVSPGNIFVEDKAKNTKENLELSRIFWKNILKANQKCLSSPVIFTVFARRRLPKIF